MMMFGQVLEWHANTYDDCITDWIGRAAVKYY